MTDDISTRRARNLVRSVMGRATPAQLAEAEAVADRIRAMQAECPACSLPLGAHDTMALTICTVLTTGKKGT